MARQRRSDAVVYQVAGESAGELDDAGWVLQHATSPLIALHSLVGLRRTARELESLLVADAREKGETWEPIARALGESRQAVHRRHTVKV